LSACRRPTSPAGEQTAPNPSAHALYGQSRGTPALEIARIRPSSADDGQWQAAPFYFIQTELSPALLVHASAKQLDLLTGMTNYGLSAPTFVAWATSNGPRAFGRDQALEVATMAECWVLAWWAGAAGWTQWDSPWVIYLQHKPAAMKLDDDGMHLEFGQPAGDVVLMPLYGYEKMPQLGHDLLPAPGRPSRKIKTWEWPKVLPRDPLMRIRYWASAMREFPVYCEDSLSVDRAKDSVTIRSRFQWRSIEDDWKTRHLKLAPLSPPLALAAKKGFPVQFSKSWSDLDFATPCGPYAAVEGVDQFDATFPVLQYVNETEAFEPPNADAPATVRLAFEKLRQVAAQKFKSPNQPDAGAGDREASGRPVPGLGWYAKALAYYDSATRSNALAHLRTWFREELLTTNQFKFRGSRQGPGRDTFILEGPGRGSADGSGVAGEVDPTLLETLWACAHFADDWDLVNDRWPLVKRLFLTPAATRWAGFGRDGVAQAGDQAASCAAFARLAYRAGDMDSYNYGCYVFARELVHLFLKQRGAEYFRNHQPWHSMELMDEEVFLTSLRPDNAGWQIDGPRYPANAAERQFNRRWSRFSDFDVARFYRDFLREDLRRELNWLQDRWEPPRRWHNDSDLLPSLVQLRSLLLNERPADLAAVATPDQFTGPASGQIASCLSVLRVSHPTRYQRLIPPAEPAPFVAGLEREVAGPNVSLLTAVSCERIDPKTNLRSNTWPRLSWGEWTTSTGVPWTFGHVRPGRESDPAKVQTVPLNWNTRVVTFLWP